MADAIKFIAVTNWSSVPDLDIQFAVEALRKELPDFCACWGLPVPGVQFFSREVELTAKEAMIVSAVDSDGKASTVGYHTTVAGLPLFIWEPQLGVWVFMHEAYETIVNPYLDRWQLGPDGREWWIEACDGTQGDSYPVDVEVMGNFSSVMAANWLAPAFWGLPNADGSQRIDKMGVCSPFKVRPGGYSMVRAPGGEPEQIGAARPNKGCSTSRTALLLQR